MSTPARVAAIARLLGASALIAFVAAGLTLVRAAGPPPSDLRRAAQETTVLEKLVELARGKEFYLVLDAGRRELRLMLRGAELARYEVRGLEIGRPRVAFVSRGDDRAWQGQIFTGGELDPPRERERVELIAPPAKPEGPEDIEQPAPPTPPSPEEIYDVPGRFLVRFSEGMAVEMLPDGSRSGGLWAWWSDLAAALKPGLEDRLRLRLTLDRQHYESLYRSLPPGTKLLALPPA